MNIGFYRIGEYLGALARTILDIGNSPSGQIPAWKNKKFLVWLGFLEWDCSGKPDLQHRNNDLSIRVDLHAVLARLFVVTGFYKALKRSLYGPPPFNRGPTNKKLCPLKAGNDRHEGYQLRGILWGGVKTRCVTGCLLSGGELKEAAGSALRHQKRGAESAAFVVKENHGSKPVFAVDYFQRCFSNC